MKFSKIPSYFKKLVKDFWISLKWDKIIQFSVRYRFITETPPRVFAHINKDLIITEASLNEIKYLSAKRIKQFFDYKARLKLNHKCLIARWNGSKEITGYIWIAVNKYRFPETLLKIKLKKDEAYLYNGYVFPKFRGKSILLQLLFKAAVILFPLNYKKIYGLISNTNLTMMKFAVPKYEKIGLHFFKYLKPIKAKPRNPFLQDIYELIKIIRYFKNYYNKLKGNLSN